MYFSNKIPVENNWPDISNCWPFFPHFFRVVFPFECTWKKAVDYFRKDSCWILQKRFCNSYDDVEFLCPRDRPKSYARARLRWLWRRSLLCWIDAQWPMYLRGYVWGWVLSPSQASSRAVFLGDPSHLQQLKVCRESRNHTDLTDSLPENSSSRLKR